MARDSRDHLWPDRRIKPPFGATVLAKKEILWAAEAIWPLNEGAGFPINLVNSQTSALRAGRASWAATAKGRALDFNGASSLDTGEASAFGTTDFSIECWLVTTNPTAFEVFLGADVGGGRNWTFNYSSITSKRITFFSNVTSTGVVTASADLVSGVPVHAAVTRSGNNFVLYINGIQDATGTDASNFTAVSPIILGARGFSGFEQFMTGQIIKAGIWNRTLSAAEVWSLYSDPYGSLRPKAIRRYFVPAVAPFQYVPFLSEIPAQARRHRREGSAVFRMLEPFIPTAVTSFRKTLSRIGTRTGGRQTHA